MKLPLRGSFKGSIGFRINLHDLKDPKLWEL